MNAPNPESLKLIGHHKNRIIAVYRAALNYFKHDVPLWKEYIKFLIKCVSYSDEQ